MYVSRSIDELRGDVAVNCRAFLALCKTQGLEVLVTETVRDEEYQRYLYDQGRTRPGSIITNSPRPSFHAKGIGLAFDFCKNVKGHEFDDPAFFKRCGEIGEQVGFEWGGRWTSFPDRPHMQWSGPKKDYTSRDIWAWHLPPTMPEYEEEIDLTKAEVQAMIDAAVRAAQPKVYTSLEEVPKWARGLVEKAMRAPQVKEPGKMMLQGDAAGKLRLTDGDLTTLQIFNNAGVLG